MTNTDDTDATRVSHATEELNTASTSSKKPPDEKSTSNEAETSSKTGMRKSVAICAAPVEDDPTARIKKNFVYDYIMEGLNPATKTYDSIPKLFRLKMTGYKEDQIFGEGEEVLHATVQKAKATIIRVTVIVLASIIMIGSVVYQSRCCCHVSLIQPAA